MSIPSFTQVRQIFVQKFQLFRDRFDQTLTVQQQKIAAIAFALLGSLATAYILFRCFWNNGDKEERRCKELGPVRTPEENVEANLEIPVIDKAKGTEGSPQKLLSPGKKLQEDQFKNGTLTGPGTITFPDGEIWSGKFENGLLDGEGRIAFADGTTLEGEFEKGVMKGEVQVSFPEGKVWKGKAEIQEPALLLQVPEEEKVSFPPKKNGKEDDEIDTEETKEGLLPGAIQESAKIEGELIEGMLEGVGRIIFNGGKIHEGNFKKGALHGNGKKIIPGVRTLEGQFHEGHLVDVGTMSWANGDIFIGKFRGGKLLDGPGKIIRANGHVYAGEFQGGKLNGFGEIAFKDGRRHKGNFKDNELEGTGVKFGKQGQVLTGVFRNGHLEGTGTYTKRDGSIVAVELINGKLQRTNEQQQSLGQVEMINEEKQKAFSVPLIFDEDWDLQSLFKVDGHVPAEQSVTPRKEPLSDKAQDVPELAPLLAEQKDDVRTDNLDGNTINDDRAIDNLTLVQSDKEDDTHDMQTDLTRISGRSLATLDSSMEQVQDSVLLTEEILGIEGEFSPDQKNGSGKITLRNGNVLEGDFVNGLLECAFGKIVFSDGTSHEGEFKTGKLNGLGHIIIPDKESHTGNFKDGLLHGQGKIEYSDGRVLIGIFNQGSVLGNPTMVTTPERRTMLSKESRNLKPAVPGEESQANLPQPKKISRNLFKSFFNSSESLSK